MKSGGFWLAGEQTKEGIYQTHKSKGESKNFLISPESFTYIFGGEDSSCINKLKICLLMLEKDFYDKYNYKVLISRPQSVFTKAYVVIRREHQQDVLDSKYGPFFTYVKKGRYKEIQRNGTFLSDTGDIYSIDLKQIWEQFHPNLSFPQFKYYYFNSSTRTLIMPEVQDYISPRQKVSVKVDGDYLLCDLRGAVLDDFEYIANALYTNFGKQYFTIEEFVKIISERFGVSKARMISNSLFDLVDPNSTCVKCRTNGATGYLQYYLANGNFKEYMRKTITNSRIVSDFSCIKSDSHSLFMSLMNDQLSSTALKLLSVFGYITYEVTGGEEPEIFIRLNDPSKVRSIVYGNAYYSNGYVTKARQKHERDVNVLFEFFAKNRTDEERWEFIEDYFLGYDVLASNERVVNQVEMQRVVDKSHSYTTSPYKTWSDILPFFDKEHCALLKVLEDKKVIMPEYLETIIKNSHLGEFILMSWPSKNMLICDCETPDGAMQEYAAFGWQACRVNELDSDMIAKLLE